MSDFLLSQTARDTFECRLAHIQTAVITLVPGHRCRTQAYLKLQLLHDLHLDSALRCTSVIQSVLTAYVPETKASQADFGEFYFSCFCSF